MVGKIVTLPAKASAEGYQEPRVPQRGPMDGPVQVLRLETGELVVDVTHDGQRQTFHISYFNAWRLVALLARSSRTPAWRRT